MRKERNKGRRNPISKAEPAGKRQRVDGTQYTERREEWGRPSDSERSEKRDKVADLDT